MAEDPDVGEGVPEPVREWLSDVAADREVAEGDLLDALTAAEGDTGASAVRSRLSELETAVEALDQELDRKVTDVRERVIQVKRETDGKAPAEHDHEELSAELERLGSKLDALGRDFVELSATSDDLDDRVDSLDERLSGGFENFEEVLEYLLETTDDLTGKLSTLARAVRDVRTRFDRVAAANARRAAADRLRTDANESGVTTAECAACSGVVHLGLLSAPECPHCAAGFTELEPRRGFFRTSLLHTGERPALEGPTASSAPDLDSLLTADREAPDLESAAETAEAAPGTDTTAPSDDAIPVDELEGIGPTYAERLRAAGVETATDLALADAAQLAAETEIAQGRLDRLITRARNRAGLE